jgi:hypothetical protein
MFTEGILKSWDPVHFLSCGWYLDCILKRPPSSEVSLHESLEPDLKDKIASTPKPQAKESVKKVGKRKKSTPEAKKLNVVLDVEALPENVEASIINIGSPSIMRKDEPIAIRPSPLTEPK